MPLSFIVGVWLIGVLCIVCLFISMATLIKAQEAHSKSIEVLDVAICWLEESKGKEAEA